MNPVQFLDQVRDRARFSHCVVYTGHSKDRMIQRGISPRMVQRVLRRGTLADAPRWDADKGNHVGTVKGIAAGVYVSVTCALRDGDMMVTVVTTHRVSR